MFNVHLIYKPPSYWRIPFQSGESPRQFSRLKIFRALVVPDGGLCKGVIIHGDQIKLRFSCGRPVVVEKKSGFNGSICP